MLYDPKWETTVTPVTTPDIWSLPTLIEWLEKQLSKATYCFTHSDLCLIAQYLKAQGWPEPLVDPYFVDDNKTGERVKLPPGWNNIAYGNAWGEKHPGHTFGGALKRALAFAEHAGEK